jgi:hypothetical protein
MKEPCRACGGGPFDGLTVITLDMTWSDDEYPLPAPPPRPVSVAQPPPPCELTADEIDAVIRGRPIARDGSRFVQRCPRCRIELAVTLGPIRDAAELEAELAAVLARHRC